MLLLYVVVLCATERSVWTVTVRSSCNLLHEGLSQLLRAVRRGNTDEVLHCYLEKSKECSEILRYLQWERQRQSSDGVCSTHTHTHTGSGCTSIVH